MTSIQLYVSTGSQAGRRLSFADSPVRFGRGGDNAVVIDHPAVSRHHGELRFEQDHWVLQNLSRNTTSIGRRLARKRPVTLREGDVVSVGDVELFRISLAPAHHAAEDEQMPEEDRIEAEADTERSEAAAQAKRRSRLMMGVGVYLLLMVGLFVMLSQLRNNDGTEDAEHLRELNDTAVANLVARDLREEEFQPFSAGEGEALIDRAISRFRARATPTTEDLYLAYRDLRRGMAHLNIHNFNELEQAEQRLVADTIIRRLTERLQGMFREANRAYHAERDWAAAREEFTEIMRLIQDESDPLFQNAAAHVRSARQRDDGGRRR